MPWTRYRGTGKYHDSASYGSMTQRWDELWKQQKLRPKNLRESEHWREFASYIQPPAKMLEAGCGLGEWVKAMCEVGFDAWGIDYSEDAIARAREAYPHLRFEVADFRAMPFDDNSFDGIISLGAVEHDEAGPEQALREMYRVLKADGILYCTVPAINYVHVAGVFALEQRVVTNPTIRRATGRDPGVQFFEYAYSPKEYQQILSSVGFDVLKIAALSPYDLWRRYTVTRVAVDFLHRINPFITCHMIAGICRKPKD